MAETNNHSLVEQFLEFIESSPKQSVKDLACRVLQRCRSLTNAEAGTIFVVRRQDHQRVLEAMATQNDLITVSNESFRVPIAPASISGFVANTGKTVTIEDAYEIPSDRPYRFNPSFDIASGYRTTSILCFALAGHRDRVVGVVQLINRRLVPGGPPLPFLPEHAQMIAPVNHLVGRALERTHFMEQLSIKNRTLRERNIELRNQRAEVERLHGETEIAFMTSVKLLARAAELHDVCTGDHILRVNEYAWFLACQARMPEAFCNDIHSFAALHDVGKMSVDKAVLHKPGRLNADEMAEMERHTTYGYEILSVSPRLAMAAEIAESHHEKWDGSGYPNRRAYQDIPFAARIVAIADIYDALRSNRPYKNGFSHERAVEIMTSGDDRINPAEHFDPELLKLFTEHHQSFATTWDKFTEHSSVPSEDAATV
ncbi:MAG: HD domain-containing phosphohydrolase [Rhodospirillaceae bacterium]